MNILPFRSDHEAALLELERQSPQGRLIRLEMMRTQLPDRSRVFDDYRLYVMVTDGGDVVGVAAAAIAEIEHNGEQLSVGYCYDLRIAPAYRRRGLAKEMGHHIIEDFFRPRGITRYFLTMKRSNQAVLRAALAVLRATYIYEFRYLTVPSSADARRIHPGHGVRPPLSVRVLAAEALPEDWYHAIDATTGVFDTHRMYRLKIVRVAPVARLGVRLANWVRGSAVPLPMVGDVIGFATLCHSGVPTVDSVDRVLRMLRRDKIPYLTVVCQKGDPVDRAFRPVAINVLDYLFVSNFHIAPSDPFSMDARCL